MADTDRSQSQHSPFEAWRQMWGAAVAEYEKMERDALERATEGVDEVARLSKETIAYGSMLAAQWRALSLEATRRAFDFMSAGAQTGVASKAAKV